jgi:hypothetical protein
VKAILEELDIDGIDLIDAVLVSERTAFLEAIVAPLRSAEPNMAGKSKMRRQNVLTTMR